MRRLTWAPAPSRLLAPGLLALLAAAGCGGKKESHYESIAKAPDVSLVHAEKRDIVRSVGQPSFIEAYERTSIYPKLTGYIERWNVDIGDKVKKGQVLATLFVPELVEDAGTKRATVRLDEQRIELAHKMVQVADADVRAARAMLEEARSILGKYQAEVDRWDTEVKRLSREVDRGVVDKQILLESTNQLRSSTAARDAAGATIQKQEAMLMSDQAKFAKSEVDVAVAQADLAVAQSDARRVAALVGYITLASPYDGIVVARNANTGDYVMSSGGDPTALSRSPYEAPGKAAAPIFVVDRTDVVRVFVDIPEADANYVKVGTPASVLAKAFRDEPVAGSVTRTSWALNIKSRTLRAEVDLPNTETQLLPGMYAYGTVTIERAGVRALPISAFTYNGDKTFYWSYEDGKAVKTEVQTGVSDAKWMEVLNHKSPKPSPGGPEWMPFDGSEQVIAGDLSTLTDGEPVEVAPPSGAKEVAGGPSPPGRTAYATASR